jgi:hypothetical protein
MISWCRWAEVTPLVIRRRSPIEIAEGALLADIAVVFQLIWLYLPLPGFFFRFLIPVVFTILVLRRDVATGLLALSVALFVVGVMTGPNLGDLIYLSLEGIGGLFLGTTLKWRLGHVPTLVLGVLGLGVASTVVAALTVVVFLPIAEVAHAFQRDLTLSMSALDSAASTIGLGEQWHHAVYPAVAPLVRFALTYWWVLLVASNFTGAVPVVLVMYLLTNVLVRLLGHEVRPFPGGVVDRFTRRITRRIVRESIRRGFLRRRQVSA